MSLPSVASALTTNVAPQVASGTGVRNETETAPPDGGTDGGADPVETGTDGEADPGRSLGLGLVDCPADEQASIPRLSVTINGTATRVRAACLVIEGSTSLT